MPIWLEELRDFAKKMSIPLLSAEEIAREQLKKRFYFGVNTYDDPTGEVEQKMSPLGQLTGASSQKRAESSQSSDPFSQANASPSPWEDNKLEMTAKEAGKPALNEEAQAKAERQTYIKQYEEMVAKGWTPTPAAKERYEAEKAASSASGISL